ncbi:MAG: Uma2 family endonuclease [Chloroflexi bacterium]|nr:Uma2 family endonuclease [Chloroflexota bacterium]
MAVQASAPLRIDVRRLKLAEYHWLIERGFFREDERVELIQGVLHQMSPEGPRHVAVIDRLHDHFFSKLGERAQVRAQHPISLLESGSEPEPDLVLAKKRADYYSGRHPVPEEVILVVEVAASSLEEDQRVKVPIYAAAGIGEYWLVNLRADRIEVYRQPINPAAGPAYYRERLLYFPQDTVHPLNFPDCDLPVADVLPPQPD